MEAMLVLPTEEPVEGERQHCTFRGHKISITPQGELAVVEAIAAVRAKENGPILDELETRNRHRAATKYYRLNVPDDVKSQTHLHRFPGVSVTMRQKGLLVFHLQNCS